MFDVTTHARPFSSGDRQTDRPRHGTALVVEDHPDFLELLSIVLKNLGYTVLQANNGKDALRLAANRRLDLLVTDLGLPEMNGLKLVQLVRTLNQDQRNLKVVMLTAYDLADYETKGVDAGCDVVLAKPIDIEKFERIVAVLRGDSATPEALNERDVQPHIAMQSGKMADRHRNANMY